MNNILEVNLSLEEIYLICQCTSADKKGIIKELNGYLDHLGDDNEGMAWLVTKTINKVKQLSRKEIATVKKYPIEETENQ